MAPKVEKKPVEAKKVAVAAKDKKVGHARNYDLGNGVYRFSKSRMYHKKALWKFVGKKTHTAKHVKKPLTVEKPIGGEKNGKTRIVSLKRKPSYYPTLKKKTRKVKKVVKRTPYKLRENITPGTVLILLAGRFKGKRVVFLKQLDSGLLLINGPYVLNHVPLRRIHQNFVIATKTVVDISGIEIPSDINDNLLRKEKKKREAKKDDTEIFTAKKEKYVWTPEKKAAQKAMDKVVLAAIKKTPHPSITARYLKATWTLFSTQYPHRMTF
ncbi:PREDICTED: 60S ribosomal protein L6 [Nicrophorus vespilloides]|uniref:Large ribosomal subunit protein eL6 n=1 Tax=Nicrophorus vespilloides TaxID=110193 RepID=A0ABM1MCY5_NICVS|nr:PREDICTED: 60S ribosomal protein L6 [Nicrophorus vespilloides]XP_017772435.1 PREDICTED: 60S ribosomal protein L6 [Nicrophorus vespilloides]